MINAFFSRFSGREKIVFYLTTSAILLLLLDRFVFNPIVVKTKFYGAEIQKQEASIRKNLRILDQKDKIKKEESKYSSFYPSVNKLSKEEEVSLFLKTIENMAKEYSLKIIDLKPIDTETASVSGEYLINLDCEATVDNFMNFVYNIEYSKDILRVKKFTIAPLSPETNTAKFGITISKIIIP